MELLTGIVRSKTITTLNNNINFVSFCDGIAFCPTPFLFTNFRQNASPVTSSFRRNPLFSLCFFKKSIAFAGGFLLFPKTLSFSGALLIVLGKSEVTDSN